MGAGRAGNFSPLFIAAARYCSPLLTAPHHCRESAMQGGHGFIFANQAITYTAQYRDAVWENMAKSLNHVFKSEVEKQQRAAAGLTPLQESRNKHRGTLAQGGKRHSISGKLYKPKAHASMATLPSR